MFFRVIQHLLPRGIAWRIRETASGFVVGDGSGVGDDGLLVGGSGEGTMLSRFFAGLADALEPIRGYFDAIFLDVFPTTTRELTAWHEQFGIAEDIDHETAVQNLAGEWAATGGQSPAYINSVLAAAGYVNVRVYDWWASGPPYVARNPRAYTVDPLIGTVQCSPNGSDAFGHPYSQPQCSDQSDQPQCNRFLVNNPYYFVNLNLTAEAPPPIPDDPEAWPNFVYFAGPTFPNHTGIDPSRRDHLERLMSKLSPSHCWVVALIDYV